MKPLNYCELAVMIGNQSDKHMVMGEVDTIIR
jgi:hypothetical protein